MSLKRYKEKRSSEKTPEPFGGKPDGKILRFVIQKHAASHLHYDFRLEMEGVLKSWAVPKGPSTDPQVKRLAMMVEDHPYDYRNFEGIIPKGEYGGGTVMLWDEGTYLPDEPAKDKKSNEKKLLHGLYSGKIKFTLHGQKLKGEYALVKAPGRGDNAWLLMKSKDEHARSEDITLLDKSVRSGQTLSEIAQLSTNVYGQQAPEREINGENISDESGNPISNKADDPDIDVQSILKSAPKARFNTGIKPMLATLVDAPFDDAGWQYEVKWDGYRAIAFMSEDAIELKSRNNKSFNEKFYPVYAAIQQWKINAIVDGEIVVVGENGVSNFSALQNWRSEVDGELLFYVFDILWLDGKDLTNLAQKDRTAILQTLVPQEGIIRMGFCVQERGTEFFNVASQMGLEGIIAKRMDAVYQPAARTKDWLKIKALKRQEVIIAGFTKNDDSPKHFSSLLLGAYKNGKLEYVGRVGTGFSDKKQKEMMALFKPLIIKKSAFAQIPDYNKPTRFRPNPPNATASWLKPELVCEVEFTEITEDGVLRHPSFVALREDKNADQVTLESAVKAPELTGEKKTISSHELVRPAVARSGKTLLNPKEKSQCKKLNGHEVKFSNLDKVYWPESGITKREMINYYFTIAPYILPYLSDRPESLNRHPNGIKGPSFYQKDVTGKVPSWIQTYQYKSSDDPKEKNYLVANDEATLLYMANLGVIEINPWSSNIQEPDNPTWCIIDLDPADKTTFEQVIQAAQVTKQVLDELGVPSYPKTSGSTGIHIFIPFGSKYTYEQSQEFARIVVTLVHERIPEFTSLERAIRSRHGKMYLDFLQNRPGATLAAPYSVRPKPGATVSMPLDWDEVKPGLKMSDFTIFNALERVQSLGDLFKPVLGPGIDLLQVVGG